MYRQPYCSTLSGESHAPAALFLAKEITVLNRKLGGCHSWSGRSEKNPCPCRESNPVHTVRNLATISTELPWIPLLTTLQYICTCIFGVIWYWNLIYVRKVQKILVLFLLIWKIIFSCMSLPQCNSPLVYGFYKFRCTEFFLNIRKKYRQYRRVQMASSGYGTWRTHVLLLIFLHFLQHLFDLYGSLDEKSPNLFILSIIIYFRLLDSSFLYPSNIWLCSLVLGRPIGFFPLYFNSNGLHSILVLSILSAWPNHCNRFSAYSSTA
jgi:hypothetical protein